MEDLTARLLAAGTDPAQAEALAAQGLELRRLDGHDPAQAHAWLDAVSRGFLEPERTDAQRTAFEARARGVRLLGVLDAQAPRPDLPVATLTSWAGELTVPGGTVPTCAVSGVTVSPTHRRRGVLRALLTGELRTAAALGLPLASLTVSESAIYGRFGFAPAVLATQATIDVRRAGWVGPVPLGRVDVVARDRVRDVLAALHDRVRVSTPGEMDVPPVVWDELLRLTPEAERPGEVRAVQHRAPGGEVEGVLLYTVTPDSHDDAGATVDVERLVAATPDAYAALWRFVLSMDLVARVRAHDLSSDEPLWWMLADRRAATVTVRDQHYLRVLDVAAALGARRYDVDDALVLEVADPLDIAGGRFLVTVRDGHATVVRDAPASAVGDAPVVRLGVGALSAVLLGAVSPVTLARAGLLMADDPARLARLFASVEPVRLSSTY